MNYIIDESKIIEVALSKLPDIKTMPTKIVIVHVGDFECCPQFTNRIVDIELPGGKSIYIDKKEKTYCYRVIFQKILVDDDLEWDLVGYDKRELFKMN